jgi:acid phosphatase
MRLRDLLVATCLVGGLAAGAPCLAAVRQSAIPEPAHVVVVIEENRSFEQIVGNPSAPYINRLIRRAALFSGSHGVTHPSLPNYFALFAGRTNTNGDGCPATGIPTDAPNLASELIAAHRSFTGYAEALPTPGFTGCWAGTYARTHAPWVHFSSVPASASVPLAALRSYDDLPTVAFIVPDVLDDMHDGSIRRGDAWLAAHLEPLLAWGWTHGVLVIVTWDEGFDATNHIPTIFVGPMVRPGRYAEYIDHFRVLRTIEALYRLPSLGATRSASPITDCWRSAPAG